MQKELQSYTWLTEVEAAQYLDINTRKLHNLIKEGMIVTSAINGMVFRSSLDRYLLLGTKTRRR